jgi:hypothetical protein
MTSFTALLKNLLKRALPFLRSRRPLELDGVARILIVGCASVSSSEGAIAAVAARFPRARLDLLVHHLQAPPRPPAGVDVILYRGLGSMRSLHRRLAAEGYDLKVVLMTGEGHNLFKVASFALPARRMLVDTGAGTFEWCFDQRRAIVNHVIARVRGYRLRVGIDGRPLHPLATPLLSLLALAMLLVWHGQQWLYRMVRRLY